MLPDTIQIADGTPLHVQAGGSRALTVAADEDWAECLVAARLAVSRGTKAIPAGLTWEEGLAAIAAHYLRCGVGQLAMGRDPDDKRWKAQAKRWEALTHEEAAKGPYCLRRCYQELGVKNPRIITREELEDEPVEVQARAVPVWVPDPDPSVLTEGGRIPFQKLARSAKQK